MLRFKIKELIAQKEFEDKRRVTIGEVAESTQIHRMTLSKLINIHGYSCTTDIIDKLCCYFNCTVSDVVVYLPDDEE